ncbi:hypothetical protein PF011_g24542 [Phytophthora fragariae]|uniref:Reverse transcriptase domain-containing protein n=2 Tax=Phytophthora fragariae TaxID=53985 RepID=A0A6A3I4P7_9STRA|nr:hypothetical protein PF011_g24542 [Phytophthora fragariae]
MATYGQYVESVEIDQFKGLGMAQRGAKRVRFAVDGHNGVCAGTTAAPVAGRKTAVDGDDATRRVVIDLACASVVQTKEEQAEVVAQQLDAWMTQFGADVAPDEVVGSTKKRDEEDEDGSPESVQQAMATETGRRDPAKAKVLRVKAAEVLQRAAQAEVEARQLHRRQKRKLREHERRERRAARASRESEHVVEVVRAAVVPDKGHDELVVEAAMLVTSTGPVVTPSSDEFVRESRTKRRYEKLARKARAREDRKLREWLAAQQYPEGTYMAFADVKRRHGKSGPRLMSIEEASAIGFSPPSATMVVAKVAQQKLPKRTYQYESGSVYAAPSVVWPGNGTRPARIGRLRAVQAPVVDSLPMARVQAGSEWKDIKLDTGAQFCVAGESWKKLGRRLSSLPPVDYVEGFTGAVAKVGGVWRFEFTTQYGQTMPLDALVVEGAADEFLLGEDWMLQNGVKIDFTSCEMKWYDGGDKKVVPFSCTTTDEEAERTVQVRLVRKQRVQTQTCRQVELAVAAPEGTVGLFMPASGAEPHLMLAPTLTTVHDGKVVVPIMNLVGRTSKLPSREKLGTWTPTSEDMTIMEVTGEFDQARVKQWLETQLHDENAPLSNESELKLGTMEQEDKELLLRLLRHYPKLLEPRDGCPPQTTLGVSHEIHTGNEPPIKVRPRRHSHSEQAIIDEQTDKMLMDGVIEEANGAWGFPVVLVRKKDGSVRFCIDYRLLNAITKKDVYPLPRIDDTLDNLHGAKRFTSFDLHAGYWQVPVAEKDRDKTGFIIRKGLFRFVRMPFGLANAPGTFQRMMDAVLRGLTWQSCLVYLDDVNIFSRGSVAQHVVQRRGIGRWRERVCR